MGRLVKVGASVVVLAGVVALSACSGQTNVRKSLGLVGNGPDEFTVVKRKPLIMPEAAQRTELPEPIPGAPNLVDPRPLEDAQLALQGDAIGTSDAPTAAETAFIAAAGAEQADDAIRAEIAQNSDAEPELILNRLLGNGKNQVNALNPAEEAQRLARQAQATKNPNLEVPEGPTVE